MPSDKAGKTGAASISIDTPLLPSAEALKAIIQTVERTDVELLELRVGSTRIRILQDPATGLDTSLQAAAEDEWSGTSAVIAPLTGVYYARSAPDAQPFLELGARVELGQVVALIETMKLFNEVVAEVEGVVADIAVTDGDLVEAGQTLLRLSDVGGEE